MPDHAERVQNWYARHTGWRGWEDLSDTELRKWTHWFRHHSRVLSGGGHLQQNVPTTLAIVCCIDAQQAMAQLQQLRLHLRALRAWLGKTRTCQCAIAVEKQISDAHDLEANRRGAKNTLMQLCGHALQREFRDMGHVEVHPTHSAVESRLQLAKWQQQDWWTLSSVRLVLQPPRVATVHDLAVAPPPPPAALGGAVAALAGGSSDDTASLVRELTDSDAWTDGVLLAPRATTNEVPTKAALVRHVRQDAHRRSSKTKHKKNKRAPAGKTPKLWLFYMDDRAPQPHQIKVHQAAATPEALPWTSHTARLHEPGERLARFVAHYVLPTPGPHVVLVPTWNASERVALTPECTAVGYKPSHPGVLKHVQPWVACDDASTLHECVRAGKKMVFHAHPGARDAWAAYMGALLQQQQQHKGAAVGGGGGGGDYHTLVQRMPLSALQKFGRTHVRDATPALHALLTEKLQQHTNEEVVWRAD